MCDRPLAEQNLEELYESECCEHGIHPDSGHPCIECLLNNDPGYEQWLTQLEQEHEHGPR